MFIEEFALEKANHRRQIPEERSDRDEASSAFGFNLLSILFNPPSWRYVYITWSVMITETTRRKKYYWNKIISTKYFILGQSISSIPSTIYTNQAVLVTWTYQNCVPRLSFKIEICTTSLVPSCTQIGLTTAQSFTYTVKQSAGNYQLRLTYFASSACRPTTTKTNVFTIAQCAALRIDTQPTAVVTPVNTPATFLTRGIIFFFWSYDFHF